MFHCYVGLLDICPLLPRFPTKSSVLNLPSQASINLDMFFTMQGLDKNRPKKGGSPQIGTGKERQALQTTGDLAILDQGVMMFGRMGLT